VLVNEVNLNVKSVGSGPAILALHGFSGSMSTWSEFVKEAQKEYTIITVDLLGHGGSDAPNDPKRYGVKCSIADLAAVLDKSDVSRACWLGYSMGGRIALGAAALMPDKCGCLVLEGASPGITGPKQRAERKRSDEALARLIMKKGVEVFSKYWEQQPIFASQKLLPREVQEQIRSQRLSNNPTGLANTLRAASSGVQPPFHKSLPEIRIPVLCVAGEYDYKFTTIAKEMCSKLPNGHISIIPHVGHAPHIEQPQEFNSVVLGFIRQSSW